MSPEFEKPSKTAAERLMEGCLLFALLAIIIAVLIALSLQFLGRR